VLAELLAAYGVQRALSADLRRCRDTLRPLTTQRKVSVECDPMPGEPTPDACADLLVHIAAAMVPTAVCAPLPVLARVWKAVDIAGRPGASAPDLPTAGFCALHLRDTQRVADPELLAANA
jgi:hypothetical protein